RISHHHNFRQGETRMLNGALAGDFRFAMRMIRRAPMFAATVVLTVTIAIAANATIFTVVNAVLIRSLPFLQPERIMQVAEKNDRVVWPPFGVSALNFLSWREQPKSFEQLAGMAFNPVTVSGNGDPEQLTANRISPVLPDVFGIKPIAGRAFRPDEEKPGTAGVAMIGEGLWRRRFAADPNLVGR